MKVFFRTFTIFFAMISLTSCSKFISKQDITSESKKSITTLFGKQNDENIPVTEVTEGGLIEGLTNDHVGKLMDDNDKKLAESSLIRVLESGVSNHSIKWSNPDNGHSGSVTPIKTSKHKSKYCRTIIQKVTINKKTKKIKSKICRENGSNWEVAK